MSIRTRLTALVVLFISAVLLNILALLYLARSVSNSLTVIERVRQRQLVGVQMNAHLRDAEAALYRYQIEGDAGFADQFKTQMDKFSSDVDQYRKLTDDPLSLEWATSLALSQNQAGTTGEQLITLHDQQNKDLQTLLISQSQYTDLLLNQMKPARPDDLEYQSGVSGMYEASRAMFTAVTAYIASPDDATRVQFTDAAVSLRQQTTQFANLTNTKQELDWYRQLSETSTHLQQLGSQLIGERDLQESLFANFIAIVFSAGQQTLVDKVQPHEAQKLSEAQQSLQSAVFTSTIISVLIPFLITLTAGWLVYRTIRRLNISMSSLLNGADRAAGGNYDEPVKLTGIDELTHLASAFNNMVIELSNREDRLRSLISKMAQIQDEERRLIGLDLHDGLTQLIISANMHLNALNALTGPHLDSNAVQELDVSRTLVKQSIDEARRVIAELRPTVVDDFGLVEGLRRYVNDVGEAQKWQVEFINQTGDIKIPPPVDAAIFRIAQEALANARKHAQTESIKVALKADGKTLLLSVQDWGRGFDPSAFLDDLSHLGLVSMHERAEMIGGVCQINSTPGEGTIVQVRLPLSALTSKSKPFIEQ